jgi:hypothetical protein
LDAHIGRESVVVELGGENASSVLDVNLFRLVADLMACEQLERVKKRKKLTVAVAVVRDAEDRGVDAGALFAGGVALVGHGAGGAALGERSVEITVRTGDHG